MFRFLAITLLVAAVVFGLYEWEQADFYSPGPAGRQTVVTIAPGDRVSTISWKLAQAGVIRDANIFQLELRLRGKAGSLEAGEYAIPAGASPAEITVILVSGKGIEHKITVAEGLTSEMIHALVRDDPELTGDSGPVPPEGTLLPETYLFTRGTTRMQILARMHRDQLKFLNPRWNSRTAGLPFHSPQDALILASIVEKETAIPAERPHIAAVFVNRLERGMKLQSDPTIIYGLTSGYPLGRPIRQSEIDGATPYNTYVIDGLPPTPICNPGKEAIAAVLAPAPSGDLYFVADGTGGHVFSDNIAEHQRNVAKWRKIENDVR